MESGAFYNKIAEIKPPIRIGILVGTLVVLSGLFLWQVYFPIKADIKRVGQEIANLQIKLNQAQMRASKIKEFEAEFAQVDAQFQEALRLLPNQKEIPSLLKSITQLGSDSRLEFRLFSPRQERNQGFYNEIPVSIEVSGTYHDVAVFFDKVGQIDRIVNILNVAMKPVKERSTTLVTTCDAVTYSFKGESDVETKKTK